MTQNDTFRDYTCDHPRIHYGGRNRKWMEGRQFSNEVCKTLISLYPECSMNWRPIKPAAPYCWATLYTMVNSKNDSWEPITCDAVDIKLAPNVFGGADEHTGFARNTRRRPNIVENVCLKTQFFLSSIFYNATDIVAIRIHPTCLRCVLCFYTDCVALNGPCMFSAQLERRHQDIYKHRFVQHISLDIQTSSCVSRKFHTHRPNY